MIEEGTLIEGRPDRLTLIPQMMEVVGSIDDTLTRQLRLRYRLPQTNRSWFTGAHGEALHDELVGILNDAAEPYGLYFGENLADRRIGFWRVADRAFEETHYA